MHRLVMWGFLLALIPLSLAVVWEIFVALRTFLIPPGRKEQVTPAPGREP